MSVGMIITMTSIGVASTIGEKLLNAFGKSDMASFCNIAGLCGLGISAVGIVINLINTVAQLG